jgi:hypothetical protein
MPFSAVYWGFLSPRGRVLLPRPEDEHHVHLGKRIASRLGLSTAYDGKSAPIRADYIAFDVSETGCSQFIGLQDGRGFRRRVVRFLRETPIANNTVEWWFDKRGHAGEAEDPEAAIEVLTQ